MAGDAENWTYGDMLNDQAQLGYEVTAKESYGRNKARAEQIAKALRSAATQERNGAVVTVENEGGRNKDDWVVKVWNKRKK